MWRQEKLHPVKLIYDVGSGSVGGALVLTNDGTGSPHILFATRSSIDAEETFSYATFFERMLRAHGKVTNKLAKAISSAATLTAASLSTHLPEITYKGDGVVLTGIEVFYSAPWYVPKVFSLEQKNRHKVKVTAELIEKILKNTERKFVQEFKTDEVSVFEEIVLTYFLNGYEVRNPYGKHAENIEVHALLSAVSHDTSQSVRRPLSRSFSNQIIGEHSFVSVMYNVVRILFNEKDSFVCLDVSGEMTEILRVKKGEIVTHATFPFGKNTLLRALMSELKQTSRQAQSTFKMYTSNHLDKAQYEKVRTLFAKLALDWRTKLEEHVPLIGAHLGTLFVLADDDASTWFAHEVAHGRNSEDVVYFDNKTLSEVVKTNDPRNLDPFLALEAIYTRYID